MSTNGGVASSPMDDGDGVDTVAAPLVVVVVDVSLDEAGEPPTAAIGFARDERGGVDGDASPLAAASTSALVKIPCGPE